MNWYYAHNNEQLGPVDQTTFDQLVRDGTIQPQSLVWRDGMTDWKPLSEATRAPNAAPTSGVLCSECRGAFPLDQLVKLGPGYVCAACKPIALQKLQEGVLGNESSEQIRQDHIKHEASIKSISFLYILGSVAILLVTGIGIVTLGAVGSRTGAPSQQVSLAFIPMIILACMAVVAFITALGLRKLKPWARVVSGVLSGLGLVSIFAGGPGVFGGLIHGYILWLLFSKKGATIFSEDYRRVVAETPHIKYKTSIVVRILVAVVILLILLALVGAAFSR